MEGKYIVIIGIGVLVLAIIALQGNSGSGEANDIVSVYNTLSPQAKALYYKQSNQLTRPVHQRLVELDEKKIGCFGPQAILSMPAGGEDLGGQCCGALTSYENYDLQLQALQDFIKAHGDLDIIPDDPYDVPVEHAKLLTEFDRDIALDEGQQAVYDEAMGMSHHGGPCCCKCWKWYMMSGLAKKLIVDHGWNAEDIAELWDTSSSCGHDEDTNMHQHYGRTHQH